jgi:tetratricopeptide (TPR) repeat protein
VVPLGACAAHDGSSSPFVKKGRGFIDVGGAPSDAQAKVGREALRRAAADAAAKRAAQPKLPTIEDRDPALGAALRDLANGPTLARHLKVAVEYRRVGVHDQAYEHFTAALVLEPRNVAAHEGRARLLRDVGLPGLALTDAHWARFLDPKSAEVRNTLGTILEGQGHCAEALAEYREAARLKPGAEWAHTNVARLTDKCK